MKRLLQKIKDARARRSEAMAAEKLQRDQAWEAQVRAYKTKLLRDLGARMWNTARHSPGSTDL